MTHVSSVRRGIVTAAALALPLAFSQAAAVTRTPAAAGPRTVAVAPRPGVPVIPRGGAVWYRTPAGKRYVFPVSGTRGRGRMLSGGLTTPLHTVQVDFTDLAGHPGGKIPGFSFSNNDDVRKAWVLVPSPAAVIRIEVPPGDYTAYVPFVETGAGGVTTSVREVEINDITVPATPGVTTVRISERAATSRLSVGTPRPVTADILMQDMVRTSVTGGSVDNGLSWNATPASPVPAIYVNTPPAARVGRVRYVLTWGGSPANGSYRYDVAFGANGIPASERFMVRTDQLAAVRENFFADPAGEKSATLLNGPVDPVAGLLGEIAAANGDPVPGTLTDYLGTADGGKWAQMFSTAALTLDADPRTYLPGHGYSVDWAHGPLAAGLGQHDGPWDCQACAAGFRVISLDFSPVIDSEPDHVLDPSGYYQPTTHFVMYRDGVRVFDQAGATGAAVYNATGTPAVYRAVLDVSFAGTPGVSQSVHTHTDMTVHFTPSPGLPALPGEDTCAGQSLPVSDCTILPALTLNYKLATNGHNVSTAAVQRLRLDVGHVSYDGVSMAVPVTSASVSVSFDGGRTWQHASMTGTAGQYTASWANPASARGTSPELEVTATDANHDSITQLITAAYTIAR